MYPCSAPCPRAPSPHRSAPWALLAAAACGGPAPCEQWEEAEEAGYLASAELSEASGLAASRVHEGVLWAHNDGGDPVIFAVGTDGSEAGRLELVDEDGEPRSVTDTEDLAAGPGPDGSSWLWLADIGDNQSARTGIAVLGLPEPQDELSGQTLEVAATRLALRYPDEPQDAETLLFDPRSNELLVLTKDPGGQTRIYAASAHAEAAQELELRGSVAFGQGDLSGDPELTGGDISADGGTVLLRTPSNVFAWSRPQGTSLTEALAGEACIAPSPAEAQGEAVAAANGDFFTVGEGLGATLWRVVGS